MNVKKKYRYLIVIFLMFVFTMLILGTTSYAGTQRLRKINYDVRLNADGTADVTEIWDIRVSDTNTLFKTFELDSNKYGSITNVQVLEVTNNGIENKFEDSGVYAYHVAKGKFYALTTNSNEFEIAWGVSIGSTQNKTYKISYRVNNVVQSYRDCSEFYWQFIGKTNGIPADKVTGRIKLPRSVSTKDNLKVWAHGPLNGNIQIISNDTVEFEVSRTKD